MGIRGRKARPICGCLPGRLAPRAKWLRSRRMVQVCSLLFLFSSIVPAGSVRSDREAVLAGLFEAVGSSGVPPENPSMVAKEYLGLFSSVPKGSLFGAAVPICPRGRVGWIH